MSRSAIKILSLLALTAALTTVGCGGPTGIGPDAVAPPPLRIGLDDAGDRWARATLSGLSLEQKVAQLFSVAAPGGYGSSDDPEHRAVLDLVRDLQIGGVIFFQSDPLDQASFVNELQQAAPIPLLISQDMEWGAGMRLRGATRLPTAMAIAATRDPEMAYRAGRVTASEAHATGVRQVFAPVADINLNPRNPVIGIRAFGDRANLAAVLIAEFVRGLQDGGVLATVKHFPGHGRTSADSHLSLPVVRAGLGVLDSTDIAVFQAAINAGVASVMSAHVSYPSIDGRSARPATLSGPIMTALLRDSLGFDGLVVSDALNMAGVARTGSPGDVAVRAVEAGIDMLLMPTDVRSAHRAVVAAVRGGRIAEDRIDQSVLSILRAKATADLHNQRFAPLDEIRGAVGTGANRAFASVLASRAVTLVTPDDDPLPTIRPGDDVLIVSLSERGDADRDAIFRSTLRQRIPLADWTEEALLGGRVGDERTRLARLAGSQEAVVVTISATAGAWQANRGMVAAYRSLIDALVATGTPTTVVLLGTPYALADLGRDPSHVLLTYGAGPAEQEAAAYAYAGEAGIEGRLPVTTGSRYPFGAGVDRAPRAPRPARPEEVGMAGRTASRIDSLIHEAISDRAFPGAAVAIGRGNALVHRAGYGFFTYDSDRRVDPRSVFDLASLTKVIATTTAVMQLYEQGLIELDAPVARYLPEFARNGKDSVTVWNLLTHTGGLIPFRPFYRLGVRSRYGVLGSIYNEELVYEPGTESRYSDFGPILLAHIVEQISGLRFDRYARERIFEPLGMWETGYRPVGRGTFLTAVPTEADDYFRYRILQGEVHDENAWIMGGVAGHAGLFSTLDDLARFAFMIVNDGWVGDEQFLRPETLRLFTTAVDPSRTHTRALGWDTKSPEGYTSAGQRFGPRSFGHTGFTGTSIWFDPDERLFVILLTNRVYPTRNNGRHVSVRPALGDIAHGAIRTARPSPILPGD
jgi:beta-glucosidase-like glycosyl hydrolase/CubicO group peptidase (beta-lactamase class C family)